MFKKLIGGRKISKKSKKKSSNKKTSSKEPVKKNNYYYFEDYPEFKPNLSPREMFLLGSFGGTYWRPIKSGITGKKYNDEHLKIEYNNKKIDWEDIPQYLLKSEKCIPKYNKFKTKAGTSLKFWEDKGWISKHDPYGWVQWYCNYYLGRRIPDEDKRQIDRWKKYAGPKGRFRLWLITLITKKNTTFDDENVSRKIRQGLQHWGYVLTKKDFDNEIKKRQSKQQ